MKTTSRRFAFAAAAALGTLLAACSSMSQSMGGGGNVMLSGQNEVPPVQTGASASGMMMVNPDHTVSGKIDVSGMTPTAAHIHEGAMGANGKVIIPLQQKGNEFSTPPGAKLTDEQYEAYKQGKLYVNVHSKEHPGGEIRAQLKP